MRGELLVLVRVVDVREEKELERAWCGVVGAVYRWLYLARQANVVVRVRELVGGMLMAWARKGGREKLRACECEELARGERAGGECLWAGMEDVACKPVLVCGGIGWCLGKERAGFGCGLVCVWCGARASCLVSYGFLGA
ncbi:unnamed protein product [Dovyalis caffra]|uniref:Uncharacterized protein n=1 Tax=Dovyalis caffra TaxID=77055 RepID=A0AAV1RQI2_9ROSI|nr:unnamed protein product [Dovyalis caffra]